MEIAIGPELDWDADAWREVRTRAQRAGRAYIWLNLVEQRLRAVVAAVLRPIYEPVHGDDWVVAAAGPAGQEWVQRAVAVREVSRRKGYLLDPADDNVLSFLTLPQLRELMVQHWPCFEPYFDDRRDVELALDELEVDPQRRLPQPRPVRGGARARPNGPPRGCWRCSAPAATCPPRARLPVDAVEDLVGDRYADVVAVHPDRVRLLAPVPRRGHLRRLPAASTPSASASTCSCRTSPAAGWSASPSPAARVRLLFLNPASSAVKRRERELGMKRGELSRAVEMNILHMRRVRSRLRDPGAFEIQVFDETPRFTAYLVDGDGTGRHRRRPVLSARGRAAWRRRCWCCGAAGGGGQVGRGG